VLAYHPFSLPVYTYNQFSGIGLPTTLAPTFLALIVAGLVVFIGRVTPRRRVVRHVSLPLAQPPITAQPTPVTFEIDYRVATFHLVVSKRSGGKNLAILGPSGSGKTMLLRSLAGLNGDRAGRVWYGGRPMEGVDVNARHVGYVAQGFGLYPHLTVWQQLLFGSGSKPETAAYFLKQLQLDGLQDRYPDQLSGGQRQRVALAQVLSRSPGLLLLDEPFSALDAPVRDELRRQLRLLQLQTGLATVLVTHDPEEAAFLADEVLVISGGRALQSDSTRDLFARPASPEVARLLGIANLNRAVVEADGQIATDGIAIAADTASLSPGTPVLWSIRPEQIVMGEMGRLSGTVSDVVDVGHSVNVFIALTQTLELQVRTINAIELGIGQRCQIELPRQAINVWRYE
jgi:ABC-type sulfate/molybdate transport systems ATPase subunit